MRGLLLGLSVLALGVVTSGCIVISSGQLGPPRKSVVVLHDEVYIVDLKTRTARKVDLVYDRDETDTETIIIESETQADPDEAEVG
ncbi:MAG: hypothetical protein IID40_12505 [Planctomycetes bacterium]|nr:hypothetical protein [Planctomycetota bacterium]